MINNDISGCPIEGTLVTLFDGTFIPVQDLKPGDLLLSAKIDTYIDSNTADILSWSNSMLRARDRQGEIESIELVVNYDTISINDGLLETSLSHTHLVRRNGYWKFMKSKDIQVGDFVHSKKLSSVEVKSITHLSEVKNTYKLVMKAPFHLFYANDVLTHNSKISAI